jgi:cyclic dehypoxanthinyl futalosine synthase
VIREDKHVEQEASRGGLKRKILEGDRITPQEALDLFAWDLIELGQVADARRAAASPEEHVGFIIDRIINFTNVCEAACEFCAFHARAGLIDAYELSEDDICQKVDALVAAGGTQVMLQGGLHPGHTLDTYIHLVRTVKDRFPEVYLHSFSPAELVHISRKSALSLDSVVSALKSAGLDSVPGASDLLVDRIRSQVSPRKLTRDEWCDVMHALHRNGMKSSATMTYGMGETLDERVEHLNVIRGVQDDTGILRAFIPWSFSPRRTRMEDVPPATGIEYLKIVAVSRIFLDNVTHIQAGWLTEGLKLAQLALAMGADDMGGVLMEEVVVKATGIETRTNMAELIAIIRNAGRTPAQRDSDYRVIRAY